jgi:hypothetical protein
MCVTDLDLDPDITEHEMPGEAPIIGQYAGVAWGRVGQPGGQDPAEASACAVPR